MRLSPLVALGSAVLATSVSARFAIYADQWHPDVPKPADGVTGIDQVIIAFAQADNLTGFVPWMSAKAARGNFTNAKVLAAVGGWGDITFASQVKSDDTMKKFASDAKKMIADHDLDGIDIDWEYPGGNGQDYKINPNSGKTEEPGKVPRFLELIRAAIGDDKLLSIAVPGKKIDIDLAFPAKTAPQVWKSVDQINVMAYDLMNRRDSVTAHHTSVADTNTTISYYINTLQAPPEKLNLGFALYAKYFQTQPNCKQALGCPIVLAEDPISGNDTHTSGAYTYEKSNMSPPPDPSSVPASTNGKCGLDSGKCSSGCCSSGGWCGTTAEHCGGGCQWAYSGAGQCKFPDIAGSWQRAAKQGVVDEKAGGKTYLDEQQGLFWTWEDSNSMSRKFAEIYEQYGLGGVFAWSLGEDTYDYGHVKQIVKEMAKYGRQEASKPGKGLDVEDVAGDVEAEGEDDEDWTGWCPDPNDPEYYYPCNELKGR
ncbi:glycoside hydrolase [Polyplosphaeria fusca]|uniref:chitinase n=1 Tax=Polyplosphaeria fusca TaxID=682080 RepID=A0A9P4QMS0_9PLEO|nr:glycoside hydrolase [Polyplosphaeria fusca]